ncbi:hypothetical protein DTO164E3_500 [Paecilomyces variotii]|nr:hypothetical protein DTO164E3_500 [Paecilomyces variotii]
MAQSAVGRLFRCQSCLRQSVSSPFRQTRSYSKNAIPSFSQTSSAELDQALNRFREELFVPFSLGIQQRKLIFRQKYSGRLEEEPVAVTIGDNEQFLLRPMDHMTRPRKVEISDVVKLMKTTKDWQNIIPFLIGLRTAKRYLDNDRWEWLMRKAAEADALGIMLECAKQSEKTGLRLNDAGVAGKYFYGLHKKAQAADFKGPATTKALSLAQQAVQLMEAPEHVEHDIAKDPRRRPAVIGVLLELSAARALNEFEGRDEGDQVASYARRLLATWPLGSFDAEITNWYNIEDMLQQNIPIYNGIKLALQVNGIASNKALSSELKDRADKLSKLITKQKKNAPEKVKERPTEGYKQLLQFF